MLYCQEERQRHTVSIDKTIDKVIARVYNKSMTRPKTERNNLLKQYAIDHPDASLSDIGKIFNISKQAVAVIIHREEREPRRRLQPSVINEKGIESKGEW